MAGNTRVSAGVYRTSSGHLVSSAKGGGGSARPGSTGRKPAAPVASADVPAGGLVPGNQPLNNAADIINTQNTVSQAGQLHGNQLANPNQVNPFGNQSVTYDPETGQPTVTQGLSQGNQNAVSGIQGASAGAYGALNPLLNTFGSLAAGNDPGQSSYENAVFSQLTRGLSDNKARESEQLGQTLAERGIPVGSAAYDDQMKQLNMRYDDQFQNARSQAVTGASNQALSAAGVLSGIGQGGFLNPSFQPFQSGQNTAPDVTAVYGAVTGANQGQQAIDLQRQKLGRSGGGGGGRGGGGSPAPPKFNIIAPPGS